MCQIGLNHVVTQEAVCREEQGEQWSNNNNNKKNITFAGTFFHFHLKWECGEEQSLWPLSGEGIMPKLSALAEKEQHVILHLIATVSS